MLLFLAGAGASLLVIFILVTRGQWVNLPNTWREEPDCNLCPWFRTIRRLRHGRRWEQCLYCYQEHWSTLPNNPARKSHHP